METEYLIGEPVPQQAKGPYLGKQRRYVLIAAHIQMLRHHKIQMPLNENVDKNAYQYLATSQDLATIS